MSIPHPIPWIFVLLAVSIGYLGILVALIRRLERLHPTVWAQLGRPKSYPHFVKRGEQWHEWKTGLYVQLFIFWHRYSDLGDRRVSLLVWCARIAWGLSAILLPLSFAEGPVTYHFGN
jgi:hypothetical protein